MPMICVSPCPVRRRLHRIVLLFVVGVSSIAGAPVSYGGNRPDPLHPLLRDAARFERGRARAPYAMQGPMQGRPGGLLVKVRTTDPDTLQAEAPGLGVEIRAIVGDVASVETPVESLEALALVPGVFSIKPAKRYFPTLDISTVEMGADLAATTYGGTGKGVIVAVIDSGLDFRHRDFRKADGTSRVIAVWDQTDSSGAGAGCGAGFTFGRCYTKAALDADLSGGPVVNFGDGLGHGTHVAGIAVGNGLGTANGVPAGTYAGVAREADIIIVKVFTNSGAYTGDLTAAYSWIRDQSAAKGEPFVINMSLGSDFGAHDGTDPDEISLDAMLAAPNTGRAAAIATGNSRGGAVHIEGTAVVGVSNDHPFAIPVYTPVPGPNNDELNFDLWYEGGDNLTVSVVDAGGLVLATAARGTKTGPICTTSGAVTIDARNTTDPDDLDSEVSIVVVDDSVCVPATPPPSGATLKLRVTGVGVPQGGHYHSWNVAALDSPSHCRFTTPIESSIVTIPGTSFNATSVGAYVTRDCWPNADPNTGTTCTATSEPIGGVAGFSSNGPTRDGRLKPEIAAPGERVASSLSSSVNAALPLRTFDGLHFSLRGTSMASPHVAGALAILFQLNPKLTAVQARDSLGLSARADSFTGAVPNELAGNGKLDVFGGTQEILKLVQGIFIDDPGGLTWSAEPHSVTYNVYRGVRPGPLPASFGTCLASALASPGFVDNQLPAPRQAFIYIVTGVRNGIEGSLGFDGTGKQRINTSPCP